MGRPNKTGVKWRSRGEDEKERMRHYQREYKAKNFDKYRKIQKTYELRVKYDLTYEDYEEMLRNQEGKCKICDRVAILHVDHCHETKRVRGLLCNRCNLGLGHFGDDKSLLKKAQEYL